jgi:oligoribonuclease
MPANGTAPTTKRMGKYLLWFDTEYSDLDLERAALLQVSALITDLSLRPVLPGEKDIHLCIRLADDIQLSPWVENNIPDLVAACRASSAVDCNEADRLLAEYIDAVAGPPAEREDMRPFLAGNSVHADWRLALKFLPRFVGRLHYRHLDVTALKIEWGLLHPGEEFKKENPENIKRYFPEARLPAAGVRHDAYYDIQASIAELAFYRKHLFNV